MANIIQPVGVSNGAMEMLTTWIRSQFLIPDKYILSTKEIFPLDVNTDGKDIKRDILDMHNIVIPDGALFQDTHTRSWIAFSKPGTYQEIEFLLHISEHEHITLIPRWKNIVTHSASFFNRRSDCQPKNIVINGRPPVPLFKDSFTGTLVMALQDLPLPLIKTAMKNLRAFNYLEEEGTEAQYLFTEMFANTRFHSNDSKNSIPFMSNAEFIQSLNDKAIVKKMIDLVTGMSSFFPFLQKWKSEEDLLELQSRFHQASTYLHLIR